MTERINFTKRSLERIPLPDTGKTKDYYDVQTRNLLLRVTASGGRSYYLRRKLNGHSERMFIGRYPDLSIEDARARAAVIKSAIARGENPRQDKRSSRSEVTLGQLFRAYLTGHAMVRCTSWKEIAACYRRYLRDWTDRQFVTIQRSDVQERLNHIAREHGVYSANRSLADMKAAINWCIRQELTAGINPWVGIAKFRTAARERFVRPDELSQFFAALQSLPSATVRDFIYISLLTGARRGNVLAMRWADIDLTLKIWRIPRTKNGESQTLPLSKYALEILRERHGSLTRSEWVFPGNKGVGHLVEPKSSWRSLLQSAGIEDLRLHDLRRTLGSYMAMNNQGLPVIGAVLGHKSASATQIYARLACDSLREAIEHTQDRIWSLAGLKVLRLESHAGDSQEI